MRLRIPQVAVRISQRRAFTLVELVVSISVGVVISGVASSLLWNASKQHSEVAARTELMDVAAGALEQMVRHVREVGQGGAPGPLNGQARITTASSNDFRFVRTDQATATDINTGFRRNAAASLLEMTTDNAVTWRTLATEVSALTLTYYNRKDQDLSLLAFPDSEPINARRARITLTLTRGTQVAKVQTSVYFRSFMNEVDLAP